MNKIKLISGSTFTIGFILMFYTSFINPSLTALESLKEYPLLWICSISLISLGLLIAYREDIKSK